MASDVCERGGGDETHSERAWEVVVLPVALVAEVEGVLLLPLVGVAEQNHLTQKSVHDHVPVVDLDVDPLFGFFAIEEAFNIKVWAACVLLNW